ncbi:MAG TPA: hypothetical protein VFC26_06340 [Verrucomicrobiae bacterium]|nr:hypothetical protein [Verrucomicrobiae bacterium]
MKVNKSNVFVSTFSNSDEAPDRQRLEQRLTEVQRNARSVWRAVRVMVFLTALAVVGLGHSTVLIPDWPQTMRQFLMFLPVKAHCALGLASLSCALFFTGLGLFYRRELSGLRLECQRVANEIIPSPDPVLVSLPIATIDKPLDEAA